MINFIAVFYFMLFSVKEYKDDSGTKTIIAMCSIYFLVERFLEIPPYFTVLGGDITATKIVLMIIDIFTAFCAFFYVVGVPAEEGKDRNLWLKDKVFMVAC